MGLFQTICIYSAYTTDIFLQLVERSFQPNIADAIQPAIGRSAIFEIDINIAHTPQANIGVLRGQLVKFHITSTLQL